MLTKPVTRTVVRSVCRNITGLTQRWALNFDGVGIRGVLANRAINPDGDNSIEFYMPSNVATGGASRTILGQTADTSNNSNSEFLLFISSVSGNLGVTFGGATFAAADAGSFLGGHKCRITFTGTNCLFENLTTGFSINKAFTKGVVREPAVATVIGARGNIAGFTQFFIGAQRDIKINGTLWPIAARNQAIQPSVPAGNNMTISNATSANWVEIPA